MNALLAIILTIYPFLLGCNDTPKPPIPIVQVPAETDYTSYLSWEIALSLGDSLNPKPSPSPNPPVPVDIKIGDTCPKCLGSGKLDGDHDGRIDSECRACGADGKIDKGDPILGVGDKGPAPPQPIIELTDATYVEAVKSPQPMLLETYGAGCTPCVTMNRYIQSIHKTYGDQIRVYRLSVDTNPIIKRHLAITRIPGLFIIQDNKILDARVGLFPEKDIITWVKQSVPLTP